MAERRNYYPNPVIADALVRGDAAFVDQVGKADVYIDRACVVEIVKDWEGDTPIDQHGKSYTYNHGQLKFPRIAHKLRAMRLMMWGEDNDGFND